MSIKEIDLAREKVFENAQALVEDAEILFSNHRYARAYALAHLACEELAKLPMLVTAGLELACGRRVDWKKLDKRFRSHSEKWHNLHIVDYTLSEIILNGKDCRDYLEAASKTGIITAAKNAALSCSSA